MRPITFPKTNTDEWANAETGVKVVRHAIAGYLVCRPDRSAPRGFVIPKNGFGKLGTAKQIAADIAEQMREQIAEAYAEAESVARAVSGHADSYETGADGVIVKVNADTTWFGNAVRAELQRREERREAEYAEPTSDEIIHFWPDIDPDKTALCGVDIMRTAYTFGSPEWDEVTCRQCKAVRPETLPAEPPDELVLDAKNSYDFAKNVIAGARKPSTSHDDMKAKHGTCRHGFLLLGNRPRCCPESSPTDMLPRTPIEAYLTGETDTIDLPVLDPAALIADIPDEALAMNAGFDMARRTPTADDLAFAANVRRFQ